MKQFLKTYSLPLVATCLFGLGLAGLMTFRFMQLAEIPTQLLESSEAGASQVSLVSQDELDEIELENGSLDATDSAPAQPLESQSSLPTTSPGSGGSNDSNVDSNDNGQTPAFITRIASIQYQGATPTNSDFANCSLMHTFEAIVETNHGPGQVTYYWQRSNGDTSEPEQIQASSGNKFYSITHRWTITTRRTEEYKGWVQLILTKPDSAESRRLEFTHSCMEA